MASFEEFRVVGIESPFRTRYEEGPFLDAGEAREAAATREKAGDSARVEGRVVTTTAWERVDGEG